METGLTDAAAGSSGLRTLVPALALELEGPTPSTEPIHRQIEGSLLSADISGFTRLTESLAELGREGAEVITKVVNACFADLISAAQRFGGDVIKFGGDAILVLYTGTHHQARASKAGQEMQAALRRNSQARRHELLMTVGVCDGPFEALVIGNDQRDVLICGANTSRTLELEAAAEKGEVVASASVVAAIAAEAGDRSGGVVVHDERLLRPAPDFPDHATESSIARFVPASVRAHYGDYADQGAQHRQAAIGFLMIGGIDEYLESHGGLETAKALSALIAESLERLKPTGVTILHSDMAMGGVKLILGAGVPSASGDHADALVHASLALAAIESPFEIRQGLQIGTVFAGFLGADHRRTFTVMGDAVNTAARMTGQADPGAIVAVEDIRRRARAQIEGDELAPFLVKGKTEPINAVRIRAIGQADDRSADAKVPFIGRDPEVQALQDAIRSGESAAIIGPAGSGKTRLSEEVIEGDNAVVASGGRYTSATPYAAFWAPLRRCIGIGPQLDTQSAGEALQRLLDESFPELAGQASLIAPAFAADLPESDEVAAIAPEFRRDALHRCLATFMGLLTPPVTAILTEDTQWLDDASAELLDHLERDAQSNGWTIVRSSRELPTVPPEPTEDGEPSDEPETGVIEVHLGALDPAAIEAIIVGACPRRLLRHELDGLVERSEGNPLFAIELAMAAARPGSDLPESIEELIIARIDRLPADQRSSVRLASVFGARFDHADFYALAEAADFDLEPDLAKIGEIFAVEDGVVFFQQLLYRDAAYSSLPFGRRKTLHAAVGDHIESVADDVDAVSTLLSQHFSLAGDRRRCWHYSTRAAQRAQRQHSPADAEVLYRRALDMAPKSLDPDERAGAFTGLAEALLSTGSLAEAHQLFGRARKSASDDGEKLRLLGRQGTCRQRQGRFSDALRVFTRMIKASAEVPAALAAAYNGRAAVAYRLGRFDEVIDNAHQALAIAEQVDLAVEQAQALKLMHTAAEASGHADFAQFADRALALVRPLGELSLEAEILNNIGVSDQLGGNLDNAAAAYRDSLDLKQRVGDRAGAAMVQMNLSEVELDRDVTAGVDELLNECIAEFDSAGFTIGSTYSQGLLGRHALLIGEARRAADLLSGAAIAFAELGAESYSADMELMLIEAQLELGLAEDAKSLLDRNTERVERGSVFENAEAAAARLQVLEQRLAGFS